MSSTLERRIIRLEQAAGVRNEGELVAHALMAQLSPVEREQRLLALGELVDDPTARTALHAALAELRTGTYGARRS